MWAQIWEIISGWFKGLFGSKVGFSGSDPGGKPSYEGHGFWGYLARWQDGSPAEAGVRRTAQRMQAVIDR
jgi:hypothetical protein